MDDLLTSQSIEGHVFIDFEMFDAKIARALRRGSSPIGTSEEDWAFLGEDRLLM